MTNSINARAVLDELMNSVQKQYRPSYKWTNLAGYTLTLFHEAAHALRAAQFSIPTYYIHVTPNEDGGSSGIPNPGHNRPQAERSVIDAEVSLAGYCADRLFSSLPEYDPIASKHDLWLATVSLDRGVYASEVMWSYFKKLLSDKPTFTLADIDDRIKEAHRLMLDKSSPEDVPRIRSKDEALHMLNQLIDEGDQWIIDNLQAMKYLVADLPKRRQLNSAFNPGPTIPKVLRLFPPTKKRPMKRVSNLQTATYAGM